MVVQRRKIFSARTSSISDWWLRVKFARDFHKTSNLIGDKREIKTSLVIKPAQLTSPPIRAPERSKFRANKYNDACIRYDRDLESNPSVTHAVTWETITQKLAYLLLKFFFAARFVTVGVSLSKNVSTRLQLIENTFIESESKILVSSWLHVCGNHQNERTRGRIKADCVCCYTALSCQFCVPEIIKAM